MKPAIERTSNGLPPIHPDEYIREALQDLGLTPAALASALGISPTRVSHLLQGGRPFTPEELARMTPSARKLCELLGKYPAPRRLTHQEIELLRASKRELAALAFSKNTRSQ